MSAKATLNHKLGPLKTWQWLVIGTGAGVVWFYLKRREKPPGGEVDPEAEEKLLGALGRGGGAGGGTGGGESVGAPGPVGIPGEPGIAGPPGESVNLAPIESRLGSVEQQLLSNNPPALSHTSAPAKHGANEFTHVNPKTGEHYKVVHEHGKTIHVYHNGHRVTVGAKAKHPTGHQQKPKPAHRPKPTSIKHRVHVGHHPPAAAKPKPVHHPAPAHKKAPAAAAPAHKKAAAKKHKRR